MAVVVTVLIGALFTASALVSMIVFDVSGWTVLLSYGVYCLTIAAISVAVFVFVGVKKPKSETAFEQDAGTARASNPLDGHISVSGPQARDPLFCDVTACLKSSSVQGTDPKRN